MTIGAVNITELQNNLGLPPPDFADIAAVAGCCSAGPVDTPALYASPRGLRADFGDGPAVEAACNIMSRTGKYVLFNRTTSSTAGTVGTQDTSDITGTALVSVSGTPIIDGDLHAEVIDGGELGVDEITIKWSLDDGVTQSVSTLLSGYTYTVPYFGPSVSSGAVVAFDPPSAQVTAFISAVNEARTDLLAHMADASAHDGADTNAGQVALAAASPAATGAQAWALMNLVRTAYELHRVNITSVHNSADSTNALAHAAATSVQTGIDLYLEFKTDYAAHIANATVHNSADVTNVLSSTAPTHGTLNAGDVFTCPLTGPRPISADLTSAIEALRVTELGWRFLLLVTEIDATIAAVVSNALDTLNDSAKRRNVIASARWIDEANSETETEWVTDLRADFQNFNDRRIGVVAGIGLLTDSLTSRAPRRSAAIVAAARQLNVARHINLAKVADGPLDGFQIVNADGVLVGHDDGPQGNVTGLDAARFITTRRYVGRNGCYLTDSPTMAEQGTDIHRLNWGDVLNRAEEIAYASLVDFVHGDVFVNEDGTVVEEDLIAIEVAVRRALKNELRASISNIDEPTLFVLQRDDNVLTTETLTGTLLVRPKGNVATFEITVGLQPPTATEEG